ncbi:hypothetical protein RC81_16060 [Pectobacterium brasiliense]|nr:hypothetical protein RC81_16060 [Pectobacterium brasiliense]
MKIQSSIALNQLILFEIMLRLMGSSLESTWELNLISLAAMFQKRKLRVLFASLDTEQLKVYQVDIILI